MPNRDFGCKRRRCNGRNPCGRCGSRKALKAEIAYYAKRFREEQCKALSVILDRYGFDRDDVPPLLWWAGHAEIVAFVEHYLHRLEAEPQIAHQ